VQRVAESESRNPGALRNPEIQKIRIQKSKRFAQSRNPEIQEMSVLLTFRFSGSLDYWISGFLSIVLR
jgi:hypothetical protein